MELISKVIKNDIDENKLIRLWKTKHDNNIALYFFNKYKDEILNITYSKINRKFSSIPIEKGDLFHVVWDSVLRCLKKFDLDKKVNFKAMLINKTYDLSIREAIKFLTNKHIVLNTSYSYEYLFEKNKNFDLGKNGIAKNDLSFNDARKQFIENVIEFNEKYPVNDIKKVIYLRSLGYANNEIAQKLNFKKSYVIKMIDFICKIAKKIYY